MKHSGIVGGNNYRLSYKISFSEKKTVSFKSSDSEVSYSKIVAKKSSDGVGPKEIKEEKVSSDISLSIFFMHYTVYITKQRLTEMRLNKLNSLRICL